MVRTPTDGRSFSDSVSPLLWGNSRYLVSDRSLFRLLHPLSELHALDRDQIESYPTLNRSMLPHHLWTVFEWTTLRSLPNGDMRVMSAKLRKLQNALAVARWKLALRDTEIQSLPNPLMATMETRSENSEADESSQPLFQGDILNDEGPWVCLSKVDHSVPAIVHAENTSARSVFTF